VVKKILARVFIWLVLFVLYAPILLITIFSFSNERVATFKDFHVSMKLWGKLFTNNEIMSAVFNTLGIAVLSAAIATVIAALGCFGILSLKQKYRNGLMSLNQIPVINADIVTSFALMIFFVAVGLSNVGLFTLIIAHILVCLPFCVLTILPRFRQLDPNIFDAGQDLGATPTQSFIKCVLPQTIPACVSAFLLGFTLSLDDFVITNYNNNGIDTISTLVYKAAKKGVPPEFRALSALIFAVVLLVLIVYNFKIRKKEKKQNEIQNRLEK
jgi:spermidine/putrescine transport system permease protein